MRKKLPGKTAPDGGQTSQVLPCSRQASCLPWAVVAGLPSAAVAILVAYKTAAWLPQCLELLRKPDGSITHDLWSWAPLLLGLGALVAVAAPVSFRSVIDLAKSIVKGRQK